MEPRCDEPSCQAAAQHLGRDRRDVGVVAIRDGQNDLALVSALGQSEQERRIRTAESEDGLIGITGDDRARSSGSDQPNQLRRLRIQMLCVVDKEVPDPSALGAKQFGIGGERGQGRTDQLGRVERRRRRLRSLDTDTAAQQHALLVGLGEPPGRHPLRTATLLAELDQIFGAEPALVGSQHQISKFDGKAVQTQCGSQALRPPERTVFDVAAQHLAEHRVLLGAGDQAWRRVAVCCGLKPENGKGVRVNGAYQRLTGCLRSAFLLVPEQPSGDLLSDLRRGSA